MRLAHWDGDCRLPEDEKKVYFIRNFVESSEDVLTDAMNDLCSSWFLFLDPPIRLANNVPEYARAFKLIDQLLPVKVESPLLLILLWACLTKQFSILWTINIELNSLNQAAELIPTRWKPATCQLASWTICRLKGLSKHTPSTLPPSPLTIQTCSAIDLHAQQAPS